MSIQNNRPNRLIGALIGAVVAISIAVPATAGASPATEPTQFAAATTNTQPASSSAPVMRRDGSKAVPFVAVGPNAPGTADGFDWGDAGIGAGAVIGITALGFGGVLAIRRLKASPARHRMPAATSS